MKSKVYHILLGVFLGVLVTVGIGMTSKAFAMKMEGDEQREYEKAHTQKKLDEPIKSITERHKEIRDEFYSAEQKINENQSVDKHIRNIEKQIKDYERKIIIREGKSEVINGYLTALDDLKEVNENVKKGEKGNKAIIEDIHYNLMENHREVAKIERDFEKEEVE